MKYIDKLQFKKWEQHVISKFYTPHKRKSNLVPSNNSSSLIRSKCVIVLDLIYKNNLESNSEKVFKNDRKTLLNIENKFISLYHIGNNKNDLVDVKLETETDLFLHPTIDFGGLTNYRHKIGTKPDFLKSPSIKIYLSSQTNNNPKDKIRLINDNVNEIYKTWKHLSDKKRFYGNMKSKLRKCIESIYSNKNNTLKDVHSIDIKFVQFTPEHRVVVHSKNVMKYINNEYYVRVYGEGEKRYAISSNGNNMYCSMTNKFLNSNINILNLRNEYQTYN